MASPFYSFILSMWIQGRFTAEKVQSYVPKYITQAECDTILATPQGGLDAVEPSEQPEAAESSAE